jgi:hypothetical protein
VNDQAVKENIKSVHERYHLADKSGKTKILDSLVLVTERNRKHLIRLLSPTLDELSIAKRSGRRRSYPVEELMPHIRHLWIAMERVSPGRLKAGVGDWLRFYPECPAHLKVHLLKMSVSTLGRYLKIIRAAEVATRGLSTTTPARFMKNKVPINTLDSKITRPGYTQTDTVAHCGTSAQGPFISSLTVTDIWSTWTENRALFTKRGTHVRAAFRDIERALPFPMLGLNADSGSEFINQHMLDFTNYGHRIQFTRSRPYKKNDNCYVEQKNFTHVRELFGYERFDEEHLVALMNEIYTQYWNPLQNLFIPNYKLKEKVRIGGRIIKKYDQPKTPFQRLMESERLTSAQKEELLNRKADLNPFELKRNLERKLQEFFEAVRQANIRKAA